VIRVFIIASVRFYREGLVEVLRERAGMDVQVVGSSSRCTDALPRLRDLEPDCVLVDLAACDGPMAVRQLGREVPGVNVVALGLQETEESVLPLAEAGIAGYANLDCSVDDLADVIRSVHRGEMPCPPRIVAGLLRRVAMLSSDTTRSETALTQREQEVLVLLRQGLSNREIARALSIALPTVKNHVHKILEKLHVTRRYHVAMINS
jgi:DNA-binding NarL/FixJ family response regulator